METFLVPIFSVRAHTRPDPFNIAFFLRALMLPNDIRSFFGGVPRLILLFVGGFRVLSFITFFTAWLEDDLQGFLAIKQLTPDHFELKSMRTVSTARQSGVATQLLEHALNAAIERGGRQVSLETGSQEFFKPARHFYEKFGFKYCEPFADYKKDPHSQFMTKELNHYPIGLKNHAAL